MSANVYGEENAVNQYKTQTCVKRKDGEKKVAHETLSSLKVSCRWTN